jgi:general secretion pathway protein G
MRAPAGERCGFTLIELLVVLAILALLLSLAAPRYFSSVERSKETVLRHNLAQVREAIDKHFADTGKYPNLLEDLVSKRYLRSTPEDPVAGNSASWIVVPPADPAKGGVYDVKSGAPGRAQDGSAFSDW